MVCSRYTVTNSSGKLNGDPKWLTPPFTWSGFFRLHMSVFFGSYFAKMASSEYTRLPRPKIPGPDAKTEYHCVAFFASVDLPKFLTVIFSSAASSRSSPRKSPCQLAFMPR